MKEVILNIYVVIEKDKVTEFRAKEYDRSGSDDEKIAFLKSIAREDFETAEVFNAPVDRAGNFMPYKRFAKFEKQGSHFQLFESIFTTYDIPENPLICVTPVMDGEILAS